MRLALVLALAACSTHSSAGRFVTDLRLSEHGLEVDDCEMVQDVDDYAWLLLLPPTWLLCWFGCGGDWKSYQTSAQHCTTTNHAFPGAGS